MLTANDIIKRLGGAKKLSDELDCPLTTVASWGPVNFIPRWWHRPLLDVALRLEIPLSSTDFPTIEQRQLRKKEAA